MPSSIGVEITSIGFVGKTDNDTKVEDLSKSSVTVNIKLWSNDHLGSVTMTYSAVPNSGSAPALSPTSHTVSLDPDDTESQPVIRQVVITGSTQSGVFTVEADGDNVFDTDSAPYSLA